MTNWRKGQTVVSMVDAAVYGLPDYKLKAIILHKGRRYVIADVFSACCSKYLDVSIKWGSKPSGLQHRCERCDVLHKAPAGEYIWFPEYWFRPLEEGESEKESMIERFLKLLKRKSTPKILEEIFIEGPKPQPEIPTRERVPIRRPKPEPVHTGQNNPRL